MDAQSTDQPVYPAAEGERKAPQHLPAPVIDSAWEIYRFELLYFDAEFQRWQLFHEDEESDGGEGNRDHRTHIQSLLASLYAAFKCVPVGTPVQVVRDRDKRERDVRVPYDSEKWDWLWRHTPRDQIATIWHEFVDELRESARLDGLLESQVPLPAEAPTTGTIARTWRDLLDEIERWAEILSVPNETVSLTLSASDARNLLSLLPILRHWDLFGAIRHGWHKTENPPPSLWQEIGRMREPGYCTHYIIRDGVDNPLSASTDLLGYAIAVEAVFADLAMGDGMPTWISLQEYFNYAYTPKNTEKTFYRLYSLFMDSIQVGLSSKEQPVSANDEEPSSEQHIYYFAYPVFSSLGRRHFLHAYVRPRQQGATAMDLWNAWQQLHRQIDWGDLRHVLVDELEQTDLARFQTHVMAEIENISITRRIDEADAEIRESHCASLVANQMHLLFPIECACDGTSLGFQMRTPHKPIKGSPWSQLQLVRDVPSTDRQGLDCGGNIETRHDSCKRSQEKGSRALVVWNEKTFVNPKPVQKVVAEGRRQRLIAQQLDFCRVMWKSHAATRQLTFERMTKEWKTTRKPFLARKREALLQALGTDYSYKKRFEGSEVKRLLTELPDVTDWQSFFSPLFYLKGINPTTEESGRCAYSEIVGGSLHSTISEYIETGVVRLLIHLDEDNGDVDLFKMKRDYSDVWERVTASIPHHEWLGSLRAQLDEFDHEVKSIINRCCAGGAEIRTQGWIAVECKAERDKLKSLRESTFRFDANPVVSGETAKEKLAKYFMLTAADRCVASDSSLRVNLASPALGVPQSLWVGSVLDDLRGHSTTAKIYAGGCEVDLEKTLSTDYHPKPAGAFRTFLVIAIPVLRSRWRAFPAKGTGILNTWSNNIGHWGVADCRKIRRGDLLSAYSLSDHTEISVDEPPSIKTLIDAVLQEDPSEEFWTMLSLSLDAYKV